MNYSMSCLCCSCIVAFPADAATTCSGSFTGSVSNTVWTPTTSNSIRIYDDTRLSGSPWYTSVLVEFDPQGSGSPDAVAMLIGGATDCDNYVFLRHRPFYARAVTGVRVVELGKVVGGVETILAIIPHDATSYGAIFSTFSERLNLCWDGATLTGWLTNSLKIASQDVSVGSMAGFGVTTLTSMDAVNFKEFTLTKAEVGACENCAEHCCIGPVPTELTLEISNVDLETITFIGGCHLDCSELNGTYALASVGSNDDDRFDSDGTCRWTLFFDAPSDNCGDRPLKIVVSTTISGGVITINVVITQNLGAQQQVASFTATTTVPCDEWTGWIDLTEVVGPLCSLGGTGLVFRIKKS